MAIPIRYCFGNLATVMMLVVRFAGQGRRRLHAGPANSGLWSLSRGAIVYGY
jgi:hypothetical protein